VYSSARPNERRRAHAALAAATDPVADADRRAWHRACATPAADESVARDLERSAARAQERGGWSAQATLLSRAAELSADPSQRAARLLAAAQAFMVAGAPQRAQALLQGGLGDDATPLDQARAERMRGLLHSQLGACEAAPAVLLAAARAFEPIDPAMARQTLLEALEAAFVSNQLTTGTTAREIATIALALAPDVSPAAAAADLLLAAFATRVAVSYEAAVPLLRRALTALCFGEHSDAEVARWFLLGSIAARELFDDAMRRAWLDRVESSARRCGALQALRVAILARLSSDVIRGRFADADHCAAEVREIAAALGLLDVAHWEARSAIELAAWRGQDDETRAIAQLLEGGALAYGAGSVLSTTGLTLSILELGEGDYEASLATAQRVYGDNAVGFAIHALPDIVESGVRSGDTAAAEFAAARLRECADAAGTAWVRGLAARAQAMLANDADADALYRESVEHLSDANIATEAARTHLVHGEWLRRQRRPREAREPLHRAHDMFVAMGATAFASRARAELAAAGETARPQDAGPRDELTPQEAQIARLAAGGATNAQIASHLYISSSTVDYHLRKVFRKLDISSRRDLRRVFAPAAGT
jgi:DNA-binding CsgD family transcriptional regulator